MLPAPSGSDLIGQDAGGPPGSARGASFLALLAVATSLLRRHRRPRSRCLGRHSMPSPRMGVPWSCWSDRPTWPHRSCIVCLPETLLRSIGWLRCGTCSPGRRCGPGPSLADHRPWGWHDAGVWPTPERGVPPCQICRPCRNGHASTSAVDRHAARIEGAGACPKEPCSRPLVTPGQEGLGPWSLPATAGPRGPPTTVCGNAGRGTAAPCCSLPPCPLTP